MAWRRPSHAHCPRCDQVRRLDIPSRGWVVYKWIWVVVTFGMAVWAMAISADALFLTPLALMILFGGGFIFDRAAEPARCFYCRYPLEGEALEAAVSRAG